MRATRETGEKISLSAKPWWRPTIYRVAALLTAISIAVITINIIAVMRAPAAENIPIKLLPSTIPVLLDQNSFFKAVEKCDVAVVKSSLAAGIDQFSKNEQGDTALHIAVRNGCVDIVRLLDIHSMRSNDDYTPLLMAAHYCRPEIIKILRAAGADISATKDSETALALAVRSIESDHAVETVDTLLHCGANPNAKNSLGNTPLISLVEKEVSADKIKNMIEAARLLLNGGADINAKNSAGETALMLLHDGEVAAFLLAAGAQVDARDKNGHTALMHTENFEVAKALLSYRHDVDMVGYKNSLPIFPQTGEGDSCTVDLIKRIKQENRCSTALMAAAWNGNPNLLWLLITYGADVNLKNISGNTAMMLAAKQGNSEVIEDLLKTNADINAKNSYGFTPLIFAASGYQTYCSSAPRLGNLETVKILIEAGAKLDTKHRPMASKLNGKEMDTIFYCAAELNNTELMQDALKMGANIDIADDDGITVLMKAVEDGDEDLIKLLIKNGADVNAKDSTGKSVLTYASESEFSKTISPLLKAAGARE